MIVIISISAQHTAQQPRPWTDSDGDWTRAHDAWSDPNLFDYNSDLHQDEVAHHHHQGDGDPDIRDTHPLHPHGQLMWP